MMPSWFWKSSYVIHYNICQVSLMKATTRIGECIDSVSLSLFFSSLNLLVDVFFSCPRSRTTRQWIKEGSKSTIVEDVAHIDNLGEWQLSQHWSFSPLKSNVRMGMGSRGRSPLAIIQMRLIDRWATCKSTTSIHDIQCHDHINLYVHSCMLIKFLLYLSFPVTDTQMIHQQASLSEKYPFAKRIGHVQFRN